MKMHEAASREKSSALTSESGKGSSTVQCKGYQARINYSTQPVQRRPNNTGLPESLKANIENLSGYSMDDVKVHYNSSKPAEINAHAYAKGTDIYIGPGQEKHLPHEAWHVVQQKQGRVRATMQMKGNLDINDDEVLEAESDTMGGIVANQDMPWQPGQNRKNKILPNSLTNSTTIQGFFPAPKNPTPKSGADIEKQYVGGVNHGKTNVKTNQLWSIDKERQRAKEITSTNDVSGEKTTRFTAFLTPGHAKLLAGGATDSKVKPIGWEWIEQHEVRSKKRQAIAYWVKFHLLNALIGGKGKKELHLIPADKSANSNWETGLESFMKKEIKTRPIYYDVNIEYYQQSEAPASYHATDKDYSSNIGLFPKTISAEWKVYDSKKAKWINQTPFKVNSGKPAGPGASQHELFDTKINLNVIENLYKISKDILSQIILNGRNKTIKTYHDVREILDNWLRAAAHDTISYNARAEKIASSDSYLRDALSGTGKRSLTIHSHSIPDDITPQAKFFKRPAAFGSDELLNYEGITPEIIGAYQRESGLLSGRFVVPDMKRFFLNLLDSNLNKVTYLSLQNDWDNFVEKSKVLPPMINTAYAPDEEEIPWTVNDHTKELVLAEFAKRYSRLTPQGCSGNAFKTIHQIAVSSFYKFLKSSLNELTCGDFRSPGSTLDKYAKSSLLESHIAQLRKRQIVYDLIMERKLQREFADPYSIDVTQNIIPDYLNRINALSQYERDVEDNPKKRQKTLYEGTSNI